MEEEESERRKVTIADLNESSEFNPMLLEVRPFRPFKTGEEYLYAMKEDLAEWLNSLYGLQLNADDFLEQMETGVILCRHANNVMRKAREYYRSVGGSVSVPDRDIFYRTDVLPETFLARDNISNFISWCRSLEIKECLLFETDDLVLRKNERSFILCLLEVARRGAKFGMPAPLLVQLEQEIDAELANDDGYETAAPVQVVTNDLRSLHERVVELLSRCTCPSQFPMIRVADGKYRIGDTKVLIFVRILRSHVMVRVGGGWDTLDHYLDKHDPCRCKSGHRLATSAKLTMKHEGKTGIPSMHVTYNRPQQQPPSSNPSSPQARRRSMPRTSPMVQRRSSSNTETNSASVPTPPPPIPPPYEYTSRRQPCSEDSSASNSSLQDRQQDDSVKLIKPPLHSGESSSEASEDEASSWNRRKPPRRRKPKTEFHRDTVPSSWQYSPVKQTKENKLRYVPENTVTPQRKIVEELNKIFPREQTSRLPSLTRRSTSCLPPPESTNALSSHPMRQNWTDKRSQSSEDLYQDAQKHESQQKPLIFHSRGSSPVNMKGLNGHGVAPQHISAPKKETNFRRADPVRHSYHHAPRSNSSRSKAVSSSRSKFSPQAVIPEKQSTTGKQVTVRVPQSPTSQERPGGTYRKVPQDKCASPVLEKLLQHSELCSDETFLKKMEMLITEFLMKKQAPVCYDHGDLSRESSLSASDLQSSSELRKMSQYPVMVPKETDRKSPSKIPIPTWYLRLKT